MHNKPDPFLNYYFRSAIQTGLVHAQFVRLNVQTNIYYRFSKKISSRLRIWLGGFINKKNLPVQYRTYLSGSVDPDFYSNDIINRTSESNNLSLGSKQYEISGPSIRGLVTTDQENMLGIDDWVMSVNFDIGIPKLPGKPFFDIVILDASLPIFPVRENNCIFALNLCSLKFIKLDNLQTRIITVITNNW